MEFPRDCLQVHKTHNEDTNLRGIWRAIKLGGKSNSEFRRSYFFYGEQSPIEPLKTKCIEIVSVDLLWPSREGFFHLYLRETVTLVITGQSKDSQDEHISIYYNRNVQACAPGELKNHAFLFLLVSKGKKPCFLDVV